VSSAGLSVFHAPSLKLEVAKLEDEEEEPEEDDEVDDEDEDDDNDDGDGSVSLVPYYTHATKK
jgi:hypothetical protein